jgi:aspartate/methionine/tyrosine aminotransferase
MNKLAIELNDTLSATCAGRLMSALGKRLYFPKGIIAQSAEAKKSATRANATIGMAFKGGKPMALSAVEEAVPGLTSAESVAYAPTAGTEAVRQLWKDAILKKNPSLRAADFGLPVLVPGITAGLSYAADLFLDKDQPIITSDPCWDNYALIFEARREAVVHGVSFLGDSGLDLQAITEAVTRDAKTGAVRIILNFPNNPSGYAPTVAEADALVAVIKDVAENGADCLVICDDAYFGLFFEDDVYKESLFARFAALHERVLAVKVDGPTKEDYIWGWRTAFVTFASKNLSETAHNALVTKMTGEIRSAVSCSNTPAQSLLPKIYADSRTEGEKRDNFEELKRRYLAVRKAVAAHSGDKVLIPLPFNAGYFMSFRCQGIAAEDVRKKLLREQGIGLVALRSDILRLAFSSLDEEKIAGVYDIVYGAAHDLKKLSTDYTD